jgi:cytochrome P450
MAPAVAVGAADLLPLARRTMMTLSLDVAGIDRRHRDGPDTQAEIDRLYHLMDRLARASTVSHATGDKAAIIADGDAALAEFEREFFAPSLARRRDLVDRHASGDLPDDALPRDVLTTLLRNQDRLELPADTVLREVAYFPWVGSHSTSNQFVHAMHHLFTWMAEHLDHPVAHRQALVDDALLRQRFVHESLRLHPASPVSLRHALADVTLRSGTEIPAGSMVSISLLDANRDPAVFGERPDEFDPFRTLADGATPWGLSFGHGLHACLGQELAGGVEPAPAGADALEQHLLGSIAVMAGIVLAAGAVPDPDDPPVLDTSTTRQVFSRYAVRFD